MKKISTLALLVIIAIVQTDSAASGTVIKASWFQQQENIFNDSFSCNFNSSSN
jgi:hypothetical protein